MIHPTKLMRGALLALAILGAAPLAGPSIPLLGVVTAQAQEQLVGSVLFEGNRRFSDSQLLAMVDVSASGIFTQQRLAADIESIRQAYDRDGFLSVSVTAATEATSDGRVRVIFTVNEGNRAFLYTPISEPPSLAIVGMLLALLLAVRPSAPPPVA